MRLTLLTIPMLLAACQPATPEPTKPSVSYKTRAENAEARIDKTYRLSDTESVKVITVPGWPSGERCVVYSNGSAIAMQCGELSPSKQ